MRTLLLSIVLLPACGDPTKEGGEAACTPGLVATHEDWTPRYEDDTAFTCLGATHREYDLDGDGLLDLVAAYCYADDRFGTDFWRVHRGTGAGFGPPEDWALPAYPDEYGLFTLPDAPAGERDALYTLRDFTGDGRPDLLILDTPDADLGLTSWNLHVGEDGGFAQAAVAVPIPEAERYPTGIFRTVTRYVYDCTSWSLQDVVGDAIPDLVIHAACDDERVGRSVWRVYEGQDRGFAAASADFAIPEAYTQDDPDDSLLNVPPSEWGTRCSSDGSRSRWYTLRDIDEDGRPDLLVGATCDDPSIGVDRWLLHRGGATGFGGAEELALPDLVEPADQSYHPFGATPSTYTSGAVSVGAQLVPTGAGLALLVHGAFDGEAPLPELGRSRWDRYAHLEGGFVGEPVGIALPEGYEGGAHPALSQPAQRSAECDEEAGWESPRYDARDFDGDGRIDLLVSGTCADDPSVSTEWRFYRGFCAED